jgi:hypothetical protein
MLAALWLLSIGSLAHCATITWTNTSGGNWSIAANWSPNQVPTNTDTVLITTPGTYTVTFDLANSIYYITNVASLTLGAGGGAAGVQTFAITNRQLTFANLLVTNGGVLTAQGANIGQGQTMTVNGGALHLATSTINGTLIVTNGGAVISANDTFSIVTVANGGLLNASGSTFGSVTVATGGHLAVMDVGFNGVTVAQGGVLDILNGSALFNNFTAILGPVSNFGTINLTNSVIDFYNQAYAYYGGMVNQPGGVITVQGSTTIGLNGEGYFINQGALIEIAGPGCTVNFVDYFDTTQGTITNLSGTMVLGTYQTNLAAAYFAA